MDISRQEIIDRVTMCMEELTPQINATMERMEGVSICNYIDGVIDSQLRTLLMTAPIAILPVQELGAQYQPMRRSDGSGRITLNDNVLRPVSLQVKGWKVPATRFIDERHPLYELQFNKYTRGSATKPVAVFTQDGQGNKVIDYFSLPTASITHHILSLQCIVAPQEKAQSYTLSPLLVDMLCYCCGAAVYNIMGNKPMADIMLSHVAMLQ